MQNFTRNNRWLILVKVVAALFQIPATGHVFYEIFKQSGRSEYESYFSVFMAVLLIDCFFIAVLYFLESAELSVREKLPWSIVGFGLIVATLYIGIEDEGVLAFAPRLGFIGLVTADLLNYLTEMWAEWFSRDAIEQRLRNKQVIARRKAMNKAYKKALKQLEPTLLKVQIQRELSTLNVTDIKPKAETLVKQNGHVEVEPGIFEIVEGEYAWADQTGSLHTHTAAGKPYSLKGAKITRSRNN